LTQITLLSGLYSKQNIPAHTDCFAAFVGGFFVGDEAVF
jgi:hypothetical protein